MLKTKSVWIGARYTLVPAGVETALETSRRQRQGEVSAMGGSLAASQPSGATNQEYHIEGKKRRH